MAEATAQPVARRASISRAGTPHSPLPASLELREAPHIAGSFLLEKVYASEFPARGCGARRGGARRCEVWLMRVRVCACVRVCVCVRPDPKP
jgi:hypothetical protein